MASRRRLTRLGGGLLALATAAAGAVVAVTLTSGTANAAVGGMGTGYLHTSGNKILDSTGAQVRITGINWFGMETDNKTFHGLWSNNPWRNQIDKMASLGYNTLRIPYSDDALKPGATATGINDFVNPDLIGLSPLQILDKVIEYSGSKGMRVILDRHRPTAAGQSALWYVPATPESTWIANWRMLAQRYAGNTTVIGADLHNEPHADGTNPNATGACWGCGDPARDWRLAAERAGNAILEVNPNWLIFVEGVSCPSGGNSNVWDNDPSNDERCGWWGGNLTKVREFPVRLNVPNRLVYSPHEYAISVYRQTWFDDPSYPANMPAIWDYFFGYIHKENIAPIMMGEFGSTLQDPKDKVWLENLMAYTGTGVTGMSFTYWSWNPNSGDTGGIALDDWTNINTAKQAILQPYLIAPVPGGPTTGPTTAPTTRVTTPPTTRVTTPPTTRVTTPPTTRVTTPPTTRVTTPPTTGTPGACSAAYKLTSSWQGGFQAEVTVTNTSSAPINGWTVTIVFGGGFTLTQAWSSTGTTPQQNTLVLKNASWNGALAPSQAVTAGFIGNGNNTVTSITCTSP
jgi:endoglucanase